MTYVWLIAGIAIFALTTVMSLTDDVRKWGFYYVFSFIAFLMFFMKRWMVKRMKKHLQFMQEQEIINKKD
jgi:bacteriorhodopsin